MSLAFRHKVISVLSLSALLLILVWVSHTISWQNGLDQLHTNNQQQLEQFIGHLDSKLARFQFLPNLIAKNRLLVDLLNDPKNSSRVNLVNYFLQDINEITGASDTYLMDARGLTLAASNWQSERPFVGSNFSFRPYFIEAMRGHLGRYFALGTTSGKRGYYFAYPIIYAANIIGVIVIKMDLSNIEQRWSNRDSQFIVSDPDGVIFITTQADWLYHSIKFLDSKTRKKISDSRRYADIDIKVLPLKTKQDISDSSSIIQITTTDSVIPKDIMTLSQNMPEAGWNVMILTPMKSIKQDSLTTVIVLLLILLLLLLTEIGRASCRERV